jgi:hypothetical protein
MAAIRVLVPEATVDEHGEPRAGERDVDCLSPASRIA